LRTAALSNTIGSWKIRGCTGHQFGRLNLAAGKLLNQRFVRRQISNFVELDLDA
jgi:hypothetical protein